MSRTPIIIDLSGLPTNHPDVQSAYAAHAARLAFPDPTRPETPDAQPSGLPLPDPSRALPEPTTTPGPDTPTDAAE